MSVPAQRPGASRQDYATPPAFIAAVEKRFGVITWDAAAHAGNAVTRGFFAAGGPAGHPDAFEPAAWDRFSRADLVWLNPPFGEIGHRWAPLLGRVTRLRPWLRVLVLAPASVGAEWYAAHVHQQAMVLALSPRLTFAGESAPYPKDLILCCYGFGVAGFDLWRWQGSRRRVVAPVDERPAPEPAAQSSSCADPCG